MARALPAHLPAMFIRRGRSLGPTTTSATISMMLRCCQLKKSNIGGAAGQSDRGLVLVGFLGVDHFGLFLFGQALLEAIDALAEVAHQIRDLAPAAKEHQRDHRQDQNMPDAEATHGILLTP